MRLSPSQPIPIKMARSKANATPNLIPMEVLRINPGSPAAVGPFGGAALGIGLVITSRLIVSSARLSGNDLPVLGAKRSMANGFRSGAGEATRSSDAVPVGHWQNLRGEAR